MSGDKKDYSLVGELVNFYRHSPTILVLHLFGVAIAWLAPGDILTRWANLKILTTFIGYIYPLMGKAIEQSLFPEVTELYFALMLGFAPFRLWEWLSFLYSPKYRSGTLNQNSSIKQILLALFLALFFLFVGIFLLIFHGQFFELNFLSISRSRLLLGLIGPVFAGGAFLMCIGIGIKGIHTVFRLFISALGND